MNDFLKLADKIKTKLDYRFAMELLTKEYLYIELLKLIDEWKKQEFSSKKTDIGIAAVKMFDSGEPEDDELAHDICVLAELYRTRNRFSPH